MGIIRQDQTDIQDADQIAYDDTASGLGETEAQAAIDTLVDWDGDKNGVTKESATVAITSNGTVISCSVSEPATDILTFKFSDGLTEVDVSTPITVSLTVGSDTVPVNNYVYTLKAAPGTLVASTSGFPAGEHAPIAQVFVPSAATVQPDGVFKQHNWTDHLTNGNDTGHMGHINAWIRSQDATWVSGVAPTFSGTGTGTIGLAATSGVVLQLHEQTAPSVSDPADVYVINDFTTKYNKIANLGSGVTLDSAGGALTNKWYALTLMQAVSETGSGESKWFCNVPAGSYNSAAGARTDTSGFNNFSIPSDLKGVAILIHRLVLRNNAGTTWTIDAGTGDDLRGSIPGAVAGSSSTAVTDFSDAQLTVFNNADNTKIIKDDASNITTATTRTRTMPDRDITLDNITTATTTNIAAGVLESDGTNVVAGLVLAFGQYTPTVTGVMNVDSLSTPLGMFSRVGDIVTVTGRVNVDATVIDTFTQVRVSLPIASDLQASQDCMGVCGLNAPSDGGGVDVDAINDEANLEFFARATTSKIVWFNFQYIIK